QPITPTNSTSLERDTCHSSRHQRPTFPQSPEILGAAAGRSQSAPEHRKPQDSHTTRIAASRRAASSLACPLLQTCRGKKRHRRKPAKHSKEGIYTTEDGNEIDYESN